VRSYYLPLLTYAIVARVPPLQVSECDADILKSVTFIDSPGVLAGEKQRIRRNYDFEGVVRWWASRADLIILLFDAHKLDISDEFRVTINALREHDEKIRVVLNKADKVSTQQLLRVYGALMWSLGKVFETPEVVRVYVGSFWDKPYDVKENAKLFDIEREDLLRELRELPRGAVVRQINDLIKRARIVKVWTHLPYTLVCPQHATVASTT
jgi:tRNA U34 5-carboxymethylaminomethyl modifying GTPase MnmE/TrmE